MTKYIILFLFFAIQSAMAGNFVSDTFTANTAFIAPNGGTLSNPAFSVPTGTGNAGLYFGANGAELVYNAADVLSWNQALLKAFVPIQSFYNSTASTPAIYLINDNTTGFYRSAANEWSWSSSGSQVADFSSAGLAITGVISSTGTATFGQLIDSGLTASTVPYADSSKQLVSSAVTPTELGYVSGVTSSIQTQLNGKQATGNYITALTGDGTASGPGSAVFTLKNTGPGAGSCTNCSVTFDAQGRETAYSSGTAPVTSLSVASTNGFAGSSSGGATPAITISTTINAPALAGNGTALSAATTTGSGSTVVLATAPTMTNPIVGTQSVGDNSTKAASTAFVQAALAQLNPAAAVYAASTANVAGTYVNAVGGVCIGDTFTTTATTAFALDSVSPPVGSRVFLKNQSSAFQNGVWTLTTQAVGGVSGAVLTRALDWDSSADMNAGNLIPIINGTVNASMVYFQTATITTCSSDSQVYTKFSGSGGSSCSVLTKSADYSVQSGDFNNNGCLMIYANCSSKCTMTNISPTASGKTLKVKCAGTAECDVSATEDGASIYQMTQQYQAAEFDDIGGSEWSIF